MNLIRTEARKWIKDPEHTIPWYRDDLYYGRALAWGEQSRVPVDSLDIIEGLYSSGAELIEIVTTEEEPNESATFEISLPRDGLLSSILNLFIDVLGLRPDAHATWEWRKGSSPVGTDRDRRVLTVSFYGTYEL